MKDYKILIYGYGNPGRQDDGLGNALVEVMEDWAKDQELKNLYFDSNYQLNIEDAANITGKDLVIFADASTEDIENFVFTPVDDSSRVAFTTHAATPGYVVKLCRDLYKKTPAAYLLHIKGYEWEFSEGISDKARKNLDAAVKELKAILEDPESLIDSFNSKYQAKNN